ncbi:uncharacterized protein [Coffea arabica]|uniref:Uncharacterized protein isoform X3 n=1 Tax=Coffea arabica TaxID=13443 RepID=A0ABM4UM61_COFAR
MVFVDLSRAAHVIESVMLFAHSTSVSDLVSHVPVFPCFCTSAAFAFFPLPSLSPFFGQRCSVACPAISSTCILSIYFRVRYTEQQMLLRRFSSPPLFSPKLYDQNLQQRLQLRWVMAIGEAGIEILGSVLWASFLAQSLRFLVKERKGKKNQQRWRCLCFRRKQRRKGLTSSSNPRVTEKFPSSSWNRLAKVEFAVHGIDYEGHAKSLVLLKLQNLCLRNLRWSTKRECP